MGKNTTNPAKVKGAQHPYNNTAKNRTPKREEERFVPGPSAEVVLEQRAAEEHDAEKHQFFIDNTEPLFADVVAIVVATIENAQISAVIDAAKAFDAFHKEAAIARQRLVVLKSAKATLKSAVEQRCARLLEVEREIAALQQAMTARGRYVDGVAIPIVAKTTPELQALIEAKAEIERGLAKGYKMLDEAIDKQTNFMAENCYDQHVADQQARYNAGK